MNFLGIINLLLDFDPVIFFEAEVMANASTTYDIINCNSYKIKGRVKK